MKLPVILVVVFGLLTCVLAAALATLLATFDLNFFSAIVWGLLPIGAVAFGVLAAAGFFVGAYWGNVTWRPGLLVCLLLSAALTQWLVFYLPYRIDGAVEVVSFIDYVKHSLTSAHLVMTRGSRDMGQVGDAGYLFGVLRFAGLIVGGLIAYGILAIQPRCDQCSTYLRRCGKPRKRIFADARSAAAYLEGRENVLDFPLPDPAQSISLLKANDQSVRVEAELFVCNGCRKQHVIDKVQVLRNRGWEEVEALCLRREVPAGRDLRPQFRRHGSA